MYDESWTRKNSRPPEEIISDPLPQVIMSHSFTEFHKKLVHPTVSLPCTRWYGYSIVRQERFSLNYANENSPN